MCHREPVAHAWMGAEPAGVPVDFGSRATEQSGASADDSYTIHVPEGTLSQSPLPRGPSLLLEHYSAKKVACGIIVWSF